MRSLAVLFFTAAALLLVLAEQGQSAPAQEDQLLEEAMDGVYSAGREAVVGGDVVIRRLFLLRRF